MDNFKQEHCHTHRVVYSFVHVDIVYLLLNLCPYYYYCCLCELFATV